MERSSFVRYLRVLLVALAAWGLPAAHAQDAWPIRPVRMVLPFPPGSANDQMARMLAPELQRAFGQPFLVDNRPGAGGNIGMQEALRANDDHTLLVGVDTMLTINPHVYKKLSFRAAEDFVPVTLFASFSQVLVCHPDIPARTLPDLLALARRQPLTYGSGGVGTPGHMTMEMLLAAARVGMVHAPYKGPGPALQDIVGRTLPCGFLAPGSVLPALREGRVVGLAVSGSRRMSSLPDVPTVAEGGFKGFDASFTQLIAAPRSMPAARVRRLNEVIVATLAKPEFQTRLRMMEYEPLATSPEEARQRLAADSARWGEVARRIDLSLD